VHVCCVFLPLLALLLWRSRALVENERLSDARSPNSLDNFLGYGVLIAVFDAHREEFPATSSWQWIHKAAERIFFLLRWNTSLDRVVVLGHD
jgi:hypothetical protein